MILKSCEQFYCQSELVEDGLVKYSPGFDKLNLTTFRTNAILITDHS